jgi:hypothetical protein
MARAPDYQPLAYCYYLSRRVASRGLYIDGVTHVVNFEFPQVAEAMFTGSAAQRSTR